MTEQEQPTPANGESEVTATTKKATPVGKKTVIFAAGTLFTALIGFSLNYYLPGILSHHTASPPIAVDVIDNPSLIDTFSGAAETLLLPRGVRTHRAGNPPFSFCDQFRSWATGLGGIDAGQTEFRLIVQGNADSPVVLDGMSAKILRRVPAREIVPVACTTAGELTPRSIRIDLDASPPLANYRDIYGSKPFAFTLSKGETEIFDITAVSSQPDVVTSWDLALDVVIDGHVHTYIIEDRGRPFATAGWTAGAATKGTYTWSSQWSPKSPFS